jgi:hypothetical protein
MLVKKHLPAVLNLMRWGYDPQGQGQSEARLTIVMPASQRSVNIKAGAPGASGDSKAEMLGHIV